MSEIRELNKMIAMYEFPEWEALVKLKGNDDVHQEHFKVARESYFNLMVLHTEQYELFKYHQSWDYLMPVLKKAFNEATDFPDESFKLKFINAIIKFDIDECYKELIEFLKWKNFKK
jgi:hypothetical protein